MQSSVWSIAGHDPLGAAGIQADLRVSWHLKVPLRTLIASFTAQNHEAMSLCEAIPETWFAAQWEALFAHERPSVIKLGLIPAASTLAQLGSFLRRLPEATIVCDPVLAASSGRDWGQPELLAAYREYIFPRISLFTPNRLEAERFLGYALDTPAAWIAAAHEFRSWGAGAVLIKGGHGTGEELVDYFDDGIRPFWLRSTRQKGSYRGTGCSLSTAIACFLSRKDSLRESVVQAHSLLRQAIAVTAKRGAAHNILEWPAEPAPLSALSYDLPFADHGFPPLERIGFYPIVPDLAWLKRLLPTGIKTIQLRLKDKSRSECAREIAEANALCRPADVRLFVNDHWELAKGEGTYGVHLGQEDLDKLDAGDLARLRKSGLRLGVSTHNYEEAARALSLLPSYIALGPIFATTCKSMDFGPQGLARIAEWKAVCGRTPLVAIGGLKLEHAPDAVRLGADGIAVVSDILTHSTPELRTRAWLRALSL